VIDHAYNLLRLRRGPSAGLPAPPPPAGFAPPELGPDLLAVRAELFGSDPDPDYLECRMRQYMTILHAGRFAAHVTSYDPRVTYLPLLALPLPAPGVRAVPAPGSGPLAVSGAFAADDGRGVARRSWGVRAVASGGGVALEAGAATGPAGGGVRLPGSSLVAAAPGAAPGESWTVEALARPGRGLPEVLAGLDALGAGPLGALFGAAAGEPFDTHRNLFRLHDQLPERLTGALLALVRRAHEAWGGR